MVHFLCSQTLHKDAAEVERLLSSLQKFLQFTITLIVLVAPKTKEDGATNS